MSGKGNGRRQTAVDKLERKVNQMHMRERYRVEKPGLTPPIATQSFTFNMTTAEDVAFDPSGNAGPVTKAVRIEDIIERVKDAVGMTSGWDTTVRISPHYLDIRAYTDGSGDPYNIVFTAGFFNPITGVSVKEDAAVGSIVNPPRLRMYYPESVQQTAFAWDGTKGTSAPLVYVTANVKQTVWIYCNCVVRINKVRTPEARGSKSGGAEWTVVTPKPQYSKLC